MANTPISSVGDFWLRPAVLYKKFADAQPKIPRLEGEDLIELLTTFDAPECDAASCLGRECPIKKSHTCWSPVTYEPGARRSNKNVLAVNYCVLDLDHLKSGDLDRVRQSVAEYEYVLHSTHSHALDDECYRLVLPLSRPATPAEWSSVRAAVVAALDLPADPQTGDLSRIYACPDSRVGIDPFSCRNAGQPIDVDEAVEAARHIPTPTGAPALATAVAPRSVVTAPVSVDLSTLRTRLAEVRRSKAHGDERARTHAEILGRVLEGSPLADAGARDATILRACGLLAYWLPAETPWAALVEVLRPSISAMDCAPEGLNHWLEVARVKYERQLLSRQQADAKRAEDDAKFKEIARAINSKNAVEVSEALESWEESLILGGKDGIRVCEHNAQTILSCSPDVRGTIRWNNVSKAIEVLGGPLTNAHPATLDSTTAAWMQREYDFFCGAQLAGMALLHVARNNSYDPIAEYLGELLWDGTPRIDDFLIARCNAVTVNTAGEDIGDHLRRTSRAWFVGLVARGMCPGCQMDNLLVLEGAQGIRKSSLLRALGGKWYRGTEINLEDKDASLLVSGTWILELAELSSLHKGRYKGFVTATSDTFRVPYGRVVESFPRRAVMVGTSNDDSYLDDPTGLRRFWPVRLEDRDIDVASVERARDQLFAEAVVAYRAGERWWLDRSEAAVAELQAQERAKGSSVSEAIERWWYGCEPRKRSRGPFTISAVLSEIGLALDRQTHGARTQAGTTLRKMGFRQSRPRSGGLIRVYEPTEEMMSAPRFAPSRHLTVVDSKEIT